MTAPVSRDSVRVAGLVVSGLLLLAAALGIIVTGAGVSFGSLGLVTMATLAFGVLLRTGQSGVPRSIGSGLIALSVLGLLGLGLLFWLAWNGMGRPM